LAVKPLLWTLMFRIGGADDADVQLREAQRLLGRDLRVSDRKRYWKIPELWTCSAAINLESASHEAQVCECLVLANRLAIGWYVLGPYFDSAGRLESFEGIFSTSNSSKAAMPLLEWAHFQLFDTGDSSPQARL